MRRVRGSKWFALGATVASLGILLPVSSPAREFDNAGKKQQPVRIAANSPADQTLGVSDKEVVVGSCISLSGALQERGREILLGADSFINSVNESGGINGRKIKLNSCDDGYDANKAIECFNGCLKDKVFAGAFFAGSAPISKYVRMADVNKMPMIGFCTGTPVIYEPHATVFVLRAGYSDEVQAEMEQCLKRGIKKFAIIYQNDAFGAAIRENALGVLKAHGLTPVAEASYSRNSQASEADAAFKAVKDANPEAVILGATSSTLKGIIQRRDAAKWHALMVTVSVADDYLQQLGKAADGVILTQVVPPMDEKLPGMQLFNKLRDKYHPGSKPNMSAWEAFLNAQVLVEGLKRAGKDLTRDKLVKGFESIHGMDLGCGPNFKVSFSAGNHRGWSPKSVYFTQAKDGDFVNMTEADWSRLVKAAKAK